MNNETRQKVAVLGGGMGALSAVYWLTSQPGWQERYEITVHQLGWRLGGKGATGRNLQLHDRIEEHGYHLLFGFYENTFAMMRACFAELGRDPSLPVSELIAPTVLDELAHPERYGLFRSNHFIAQQELANGEWNDFVVDFPENTDLPGSGGDL
ncbi:MAG: NAD(P)-binding protein, partial [Thermoanaerobaculia bacterium]